MVVGEQHQRGLAVAATAAKARMRQQAHAMQEPVLGVGEDGHGLVRLFLEAAGAGGQEPEQPIILHPFPGHPVEQIRQASHHQVRFQMAQVQRGMHQFAAGDPLELHMLLAEKGHPDQAQRLEARYPFGRGLLGALGEPHQAFPVLGEEGHHQTALLEGRGAEHDGGMGANHQFPVCLIPGDFRR